MFFETNTRTFVKTFSWRFVVLILDFLVAYLLLKDLQIATGFALTKLVIATVAFYIHERVWNKIRWGKKS